MTVMIHIGRRVPRAWYRRVGSKVKGLMTFQENIWQIITDSLKKARKKANNDGRLKFIIHQDTEPEDMHYQIEWRKVIIQGTPEQEEEEYNESLKMYESLGKSFKKDFDKDNNLAKYFNTKMLNPAKIKEAYEKGYGTMEKNNISNKLLEMGILTHVEWQKDFETREPEYLAY